MHVQVCTDHACLESSAINFPRGIAFSSRPSSLRLTPALHHAKGSNDCSRITKCCVLPCSYQYSSSPCRLHSLSSGVCLPKSKQKKSTALILVLRKDHRKRTSDLPCLPILPISAFSRSSPVLNKGRRDGLHPTPKTGRKKAQSERIDFERCQPFLHLQGRSHPLLPVRRGTPRM